MINLLELNKARYVKKIQLFFFSALIFLIFSYCSVSYSNPLILKVGVVPQFEQRQLFRNWQPILFELEKITGLKFELVGSPKIPDFEKQFNKGVYDISYMNPYHVLKAHKAQGYLPLVRDKIKLKGVLVVNKNSILNSVKQLNNKTIAFPSPNALGASLLMRSILIEKFGLSFQSKYVQTHSSVYLHVAKNLVDAGGGVDKTFNRQSGFLKDNLRVLYETPAIVSHPIVIHPRVIPSQRRLVKDGLIKLFKSKRGKELFKKIPIHNLIPTSINDYTPLEKYNLDKYFE